VVQQLMEAEVSELVGAARGERTTEERMTHHNRYRARPWATRAGELELQVPKLRRGSDFPSFLEPRRLSEQALVSVVQEAYVAGVSTRKVDRVVESLGLRISKSEVSRICQGLDEQVDAFRNRPLAGRYPYVFPADHWPKLRSTNPLERVNREIGRRTDVVGIFPNDRSLIRLAASVVIEQNDEWLVGRRYLSAHSREAILEQENQDKDRETRIVAAGDARINLVNHRRELRCRVRPQPDHTLCRAVAGHSRSQPVTAGSRGEEMPAVAGNSGS
jgi:transposase-like protein